MSIGVPTTLTRKAGYPKYADVGDSIAVIDGFVIDWDNVPSGLPARGDAHPTLTGYYVREVRYERDGEIADVEIVYTFPVGSADLVPDGDALLTVDSVCDLVEQADGTMKKVPRQVVRRRRLKSNFSKTEANYTLNVGTLVLPPGVTGTTSGRWLKTRRFVETVSNGTIVEDEYEYNVDGWGAAYSSGSSED